MRWSPNPQEFVLEALKPAKVKTVSLDENKHKITIKVDEDQLSLAIGKKGQNARLTSRLTGWDISIEKDESAKEAVESSKAKAGSELAQKLNIDDATAQKLATQGLISVEVIVESFEEAQDLADAAGIELEKAQAILDAARAAQASSN
jgi:N utilization substance protein A